MVLADALLLPKYMLVGQRSRRSLRSDVEELVLSCILTRFRSLNKIVLRKIGLLVVSVLNAVTDCLALAVCIEALKAVAALQFIIPHCV